MSLFVGILLDTHTGWDAASSRGLQRYNKEVEVEQPYCLVITLPSSPWNVRSLFHEGESPVLRQRIHARRAEHRPHLRQANASVEQRITAGFHVFLEHPLGSEVFDQPEMSCLAVLVDKGILHVCRIDWLCCRLSVPGLQRSVLEAN